MGVKTERVLIVSCPRLSGKVAALAVERGKREQTRKKRLLQSGIKYLPVILERSEESGKEYRY